MSETEGSQGHHFVFNGSALPEQFRAPHAGGGGEPVPDRDRNQHGGQLLRQIDAIVPQAIEARTAQQRAGMDDGFGLRVAFESFPGVELAFESLARSQSGIELLNVQLEDGREVATVFVPDGKLPVFENLIRTYLDPAKDTKKGPKHRALLNTISEIRTAALRDLWTDDAASFPSSDTDTIWWEVWLPIKNDRTAVVSEFLRLAQSLDFKVADDNLAFPERTVVLVRGTVAQMKQSVMVLNSVAELRRAKETADFFDTLTPGEQPDWIDDVVRRTSCASPASNPPYVCILDTGINQGHPLLAPELDSADLHTVEPGWGVADKDGHGTNMAGLALFGNLTDALAGTVPIEIRHRLESVKLLRDDSSNHGDARLYGHLTTEAVARPEVSAPQRIRVFSMAVTTKDDRDRGRPSAWSAALDRLASDAESQGEAPRLFSVSAGNTNRTAWAQYPTGNTTDGIHDPGQSWNALTVGALTHLTHVTGMGTAGYVALASDGDLSPFSTTSAAWDPRWPLKPDVVFEGGNVAKDPLGTALTVGSLQLLTTNAQFQARLLDLTNATSAASALAAKMSAELMAEYPTLWPESIRGLIVHSAEWTQAMRRMFLDVSGVPKKGDVARLVRHCGFGEPDLGRAEWSVSNSLTMICEDRLHPFRQVGSAAPTLGEMNLHRLPWPLDELASLGNTPVEMRVTLSYFIEPNPSARGKSRYRYESFGLRFDVKRPTETDEDFRARVNAAARDEWHGSTHGAGDTSWILGTNSRHKGSIHSDIWSGSAADLASRGVVAVYPTTGWWKTRPRLRCANRSARYSLLVSIRTPATDVDLYSAVASKVVTPVQIVT